jgi:hypothetical protein
MQFMQQFNLAMLPGEDWIEPILLRDFSTFKKTDEDLVLAFFDCFVDKMVPAVAGKKVWHPHVRHHENMSTSKFGNKKPRVTAGSEALAAVMYLNGHKKWSSMVDWKISDKKSPYPKFNPKNPEVNRDWRTPYSDACGGQKKYGGWNDDGRKLFTVLQKKVHGSRKQNAKRHEKVESECVQRLQDKYRDLYTTTAKQNKRKRRSRDSEEHEEKCELMEWFLESEGDESGDDDAIATPAVDG